MRQILFVGAGGFVGSVCRYLMSGFIYRYLPFTTFPFATVVVNILGCTLIGFLNGITETRQLFSPELRLFLFIGVLGGFTTFSSFGLETFVLAQDAENSKALLNVGLHMILCLGGVWLGTMLSNY